MVRLFPFICVLMLGTSTFAEWKPANPRLLTRWAKDVTPDKVLPEYPRPQFQRDKWQSLNGLWDYAITDRKSGVPEKWDGQILVPFAVESALSGVGKTVGPDQALWYRRKFTLDQNEKTQHHRTLLHFGAVDWSCQVYLNGQPIEYARHTGGYDPFSFYIDHPSSKLSYNGENELIVRVLDNTDEGYQPRGKQVQKPNGIWYTPVSGIWQTVWIEREPLAAVQGLKITPDVDKSSVRVEVKAGLETKAPSKAKIKVEVLDGEQVVATAEGVTERGLVALDIPVKEPKLWSPEQPHLYALKVQRVIEVSKGRPQSEQIAVDTVTSYFGMRKISLQKDDQGINRLYLNNKPYFQFGPLDQGWWPDGLYTAPTDEALKFDIEMTKRLGYNMARKHVKVEPDRWYYWCDKLGLLVWQDMPSGDKHAEWDPFGKFDNTEITRSQESSDNFNKEWKAIIDALHNHPSIVMWVPFNEAWGQANTVAVTKWTMEYDPSRLVNCASGGNDFPVGHVLDVHRYPGPFLPKITPDRAAVLGEYGGLGLPVEGHTWLDKGNWGYRSFESKEALADAYEQLAWQLPEMIGKGLSAAIYTQTTDVEIEVNGLFTYDREVLKFDEKRMREANLRVYGPPPTFKTLVPTSEENAQEWRYITHDANPVGWELPSDNKDKFWNVGVGGFGNLNPPGSHVRTKWDTPDIWARRTFELKSIDDIQNLGLRIHYDEDTEVYLNGVKIAQTHGYTVNYVVVPASAAAKGALKVGQNLLAVHTHQTGGGQYIDVGLVDIRFEK
jgi:hypothetical protein